MNHDPELLERSRELEAIGAFRAAVAEGRAGVLLVDGPAGAGKSALLTAVRAPGGPAVSAVRGSELERDVPLAVARRLFDALVRDGLLDRRPAVLDAPDGLVDRRSPAPIASALADALADVGTPLILAVDDVHWVDGASLWFLAAVAARGEDLPVALAVARRAGEAVADPALLERVLAATATTLRPAALGVGAVRTLVAGALPEATPDVGDRVAALTGGNPFLVREVLRAVAAGVEDPLRPGAADGAVPDRIGRWIVDRIARRGPDAVALADALAVLEESPLRRCAALAGLGPAAADAAADDLAAAGIVVDGERLRFVHPLTRGAVGSRLPSGRRAGLHRRAAELLAGDGEPVEFVAAQLVRSRPEGDRETVDLLVAAAASARRRGLPGESASLLDRALREPPAPDRRASVLLELGRSEHASGGTTAADRFRAVLEASDDGDVRAAAWHGLSQVVLSAGDARGASDAAVRGRTELPPGDRRAEPLLADEVTAGMWRPDGRAAYDALLAERAAALDRGEPVRTPLLAATLACSLAFRGSALRHVPALAEVAVAGGARADRDAAATSFSAVLAALWVVDDLDRAWSVLRAAADEARTTGDAALEAVVRIWGAHLHGLVGDVTEAERAFDAIVAGGLEGLEAFAIFVHTGRARARLYRGDLAGAEAAMRPLEPFDPRVPTTHVDVGRLRLAQDRPADALAAFRVAQRTDEETFGFGHPGLNPWRSGAAVALGRLGRHAEGAELAAAEVARARELGGGRALAVALSALGRTTPGAAGIAAHEEAVAVAWASPAASMRPVARLHLGSALRREGRTRSAREVLARAGREAHAVGAAALVAIADDELRAAGGRVRRATTASGGVAGLTASELRVARLAAEGLSTSGIADRLVLSPRTVESHLARAYRKLEIRGRADLADALVRAAPDGA